MRKKIYIFLGTFLMVFAIKSMFEPANLVTGGFSGISIIVKKLTTIPLWVTTTVLNIPLFIIVIKLMDRRFVHNSLWAFCIFTVLLTIVPDIRIWNGDLFLAAVFGGIINGIGIGFILMAGATTGGSDMLASLIHKYKRHISIPRLLQIIDGIIIVCGVFTSDLGHAMYALVAVYVSSIMSDGIINGLKFAKAVYIISDKYQEIADSIITEIFRGVTAFEANGMYTNEPKKVLFSIVSKKEIVKIRDKVMEIDENAFFVVCDVKEVMGKGFVQK